MPAAAPETNRAGARRRRRLDRLAGFLGWAGPAAVLAYGLGVFLRVQASVYDTGLYLTLSRFTGLDRLPYRDLWTLYGPGPPVLASIVSDVFGPGFGQQQILLFVVHALIAAPVYLLARRWVPVWMASVLAAFTAAVTAPLHYQQALVFILWGLWFAARAGDGEDRAPRRLTIAALLFGLSFWGRYEFALVGSLLVLGLWLAVRERLGRRGSVWLLVAGLTPPALFLAYLLAVVGWERAWLNLVEYPLLRYPDAACRGVPPVWGEAFHQLLRPFWGGPWTTGGLALWTATFLPPLLASLCFAVAWARRRAPLDAFLAAAIGGINLIVWLEHRPRVGASPYPLVALMAVAAALLLAALRRRRPRASFWTAVAVTASILLALIPNWIPYARGFWTDFPPYDPRFGWEGRRFEGLYDAEVWADVAAEVQARAAPGEEIFVSLIENSMRHHANAPVFYWFVDRPPASRFIEFNPCLTDTAEVQEEIVRDLASVDVVVATSFFADVGAGSPILDSYLDSSFEPVYRAPLAEVEEVVVLARRT